MTETVIRFGRAFVAAKYLYPLVIGLVVFVWSIGRDDAREWAREFTGAPGIERKLDELANTIGIGFEKAASERENLRTQIETMEQRVTGLEPRQRVAEFDARRSSILTPVCAPNKPCHFRLRARRTEFGQTCGIPEVLYAVDDLRADKHQVRGINPKPGRLDRGWTIIDGAFVTPAAAMPGPAEFYLQLTWRNCAAAPGGDLREDSIKLPFTIEKGVE